MCPAPLAAQGFLEQFSYEGLRFSGVSVEVGAIASDRLTTEFSPALRVDYGYIAPNVRLLLGVAYFKGEFQAEEIAKFEESLRRMVRDPTGDFTVDVGRIALADLGLSLDLQYQFDPGRDVLPYVGVGLGVHLRNADGDAVDGTFVGDALSTIAAGAALSTGVEAALTRWLRFVIDVRGELTSELRTLSARSGFMVRLGAGGAGRR